MRYFGIGSRKSKLDTIISSWPLLNFSLPTREGRTKAKRIIKISLDWKAGLKKEFGRVLMQRFWCNHENCSYWSFLSFWYPIHDWKIYIYICFPSKFKLNVFEDVISPVTVFFHHQRALLIGIGVFSCIKLFLYHFCIKSFTYR